MIGNSLYSSKSYSVRKLVKYTEQNPWPTYVWKLMNSREASSGRFSEGKGGSEATGNLHKRYVGLLVSPKYGYV